MRFYRLFKTTRDSAGNIFTVLYNLPKIIKLHFRLLADRRVALYLKAIFILAIAYVIYPFDLLPDWIIPIVGNIDDVIVLVMASKYFLSNCPQDVLREHIQRIENGR